MKRKKKEIVQDSSNTEIKALRNKVKLLSKVCRKCKCNIGKNIEVVKGDPIVKILQRLVIVEHETPQRWTREILDKAKEE